METSQDVVLGSTWAPARPQKPTKPSILITTNEVLVVSRQGQPDAIATPATTAIILPFWALASLVMGVIVVISQPWRVDMNFVQFTPVRISVAVFLVAASILAYCCHLSIQERKKAFERRKDLRNAPARNLNSAPKLKLVA